MLNIDYYRNPSSHVSYVALGLIATSVNFSNSPLTDTSSMLKLMSNGE